MKLGSENADVQFFVDGLGSEILRAERALLKQVLQVHLRELARRANRAGCRSAEPSNAA